MPFDRHRLEPTKIIRILEQRTRFVRPARGSHASPVGHQRSLSSYRVSDKEVRYNHPKTGKEVVYRRTPKVVPINRTVTVNGGGSGRLSAMASRGIPPVIYKVRLK